MSTAVAACPADRVDETGDVGGIAYIEVQALPSVDPGAAARRFRVARRSPAEAEAVLHRLLADHDPQLYTVTPHHGDDQVRKEARRC